MCKSNHFTDSIFIFLNFQVFILAANADYGSPDSSQYHIQTDEGDERYFRYQTDSGQFRKEKRLKDGTVIGMIGIIIVTTRRKCNIKHCLKT